MVARSPSAVFLSRALRYSLNVDFWRFVEGVKLPLVFSELGLVDEDERAVVVAPQQPPSP